MYQFSKLGNNMSDQKITIRVNKKPYTGFESAEINKSIGSNLTSFGFVSTSVEILKAFPIKLGDEIEMLVNGKLYTTGYVFDVDMSADSGSHDISVSGRSKLADVVDSSMPDEVKVSYGNINFKTLCERTLKAVNADIIVIDKIKNMENFQEKDILAANVGSSAIDFLNSFARKRQVYLVDDEFGNLVIFRPLLEKSSTKLRNAINGIGNNIKSFSLKLSQENLFYHYACYSHDNPSQETEFTAESASRFGEAFDKAIRKSRYCEIKPDQIMNSSDCEKRAKEIANLKRSRSIEYSVVIHGFSQQNGDLYNIGQQIPVYDEMSTVKGEFVLTDLSFRFDLGQGSESHMTLSTIDAFQVIPSVDEGIKRKSNLAQDLQKTDDTKAILRKAQEAERKFIYELDK